MSNFFTSTQILNNEILDSKKFINEFCEKMAEEGYVTCDNDESELSYILRFADNCKWVTITSEAYEQGNEKSQKDTGRIAKMLKTSCVNTTVIDSDCAIMDLYDKNGKKADTIIMGRADDYFGDDIPSPSEKKWKPFLCSGSTWEVFSKVYSDKETFVESSLSKIASLLCMDERNVLFSSDDASESDKRNVFLCFKKAKAKQQDKTITLNAAFRKYIDPELEKKGFKKIKSRYPYYVRTVNNEILHVITYVEEKSIYKKLRSFKVFGGIASVYRAKIDFSVNPKMNYNWLRDVSNVHRQLVFTDEGYPYGSEDIGPCFNCSVEPDKTAEDMELAFERIDNVLIYAMNKISDIDSFLKNYDLFGAAMWIYEDDDFGKKYSAYSENEGLLYIKNDNRQAITDSHYKEIRSIEKQIAEGKYPGISSYEVFQKNLEDGYQKKLSAFDRICGSESLYLKALDELEQRALKNKTMLLEYDIKL